MLAQHKTYQELTDLRQGRNSKLMDFEELNTDSAPALPLFGMQNKTQDTINLTKNSQEGQDIELKTNNGLFDNSLLEDDVVLNQELLNEVMLELSNDQQDRGGKDHEDKIGLEHTWNLDQDFQILRTGNIPKTKSSIITLKQDSSDDSYIQGSPRSGLLNNFGSAMGSALSSQDQDPNFQTFPQLSLTKDGHVPAMDVDEQVLAARQQEDEKEDEAEEKEEEEEEEEIRCIDKVMQVEETIYEEKIKCHHTFTEKCHETFITDYIPTQERKCETSFKKNCHITYKPMMFEETIKICNEPLNKICSNDTVGEEICKTHYETNCETRYKEHEVEQDEPVCEMVEEKRCKDVRVPIPGSNTLRLLRRNRRQFTPALQDSGAGQDLGLQNDLQQIVDSDKDLLSIGEECELWPVQKCRLEKKNVKKVHPETSCRKMPREICAPSNCAFVKAAKICREEVRNLIQNIPSEDCNLQPQENCKMETVLVPRLIQQPNCIKIPKEICINVKTNPKKVKKPIVKQWCYKPSDLKTPNTRLALSQFFNN